MIGGAIAGLGAGAGVVLIGMVLAHRPTIASRVVPYIDEGWRPERNRAGRRIGMWLRTVLDAIGSTSASVRRRCDSLGTLTPYQFRARQIQWAGGGILAGLVLFVVVAQRRGSVIVALALLGLGAIGGAMLADAWLSSEVKEKDARITQELPDIAELLALAVGAGESIRAALERVVGIGSGALVFELNRTLSEVRSGTPMARALGRLEERSGSASLGRFADALTTSLERGTSLASVLQAQASDARSTARRDLLESGGRKEISMMIPVVFIILPVTVVFTLFPGLSAMSLLK